MWRTGLFENPTADIFNKKWGAGIVTQKETQFAPINCFVRDIQLTSFWIIGSKKILSRPNLCLGRKAEHPQTLIDSIQYSCDYRGYLHHVSRRKGMYSFVCVQWRDCTLQVPRSGDQWLVAIKGIRLLLIL
jgi:hypothetical protein